MEDKAFVLVFGTSADPFHEGHKALVLESVKALARQGHSVCEVLIMPVYRHHNLQDDVKEFLPLSYEDRFAVCQLAAQEIEAALKPLGTSVKVSRLEKELAERSNKANFTSETLQALRQNLPPNLQLAFLVGIDPFAGEDPAFGHWYKPDELMAAADLVVSPRKGFEANESFIQALKARGARFIFLKQLNIPEISSSIIRQRVENGEAPFLLADEGLISPATASYILRYNLAEAWRQIDSSRSDESLNLDPHPSEALEAKIGAMLFKCKLNLATAESCTGGLIGHRITRVPGASEYFMGGIIAYAYEAKVNLLGVKWQTLRKAGAVSREVVLEMAKGARRALNCDLALSVSGIAGPGGATPNKPVGTSWVGLSAPDGAWAWKHALHNDRLGNMQELSQIALQHLYNYLLQKTNSSLPS
ncbi:MAG: nicotinamide-nucleotide amidohydrolase family protein [Anaerolineaceae bacterium]|nr:nicotinamide-nucleotide amidohydrolase family protein [Anaerolineaceae bacterium]